MSLKSLGGEIGNYPYLYVAGAKESIARVNHRKTGAGNGTEAGMVLSAKMYQDIACKFVQSMGISRCTECPLPSCNISDSEASGWTPKDKK